jgi:hypothetical protein
MTRNYNSDTGLRPSMAFKYCHKKVVKQMKQGGYNSCELEEG